MKPSKGLIRTEGKYLKCISQRDEQPGLQVWAHTAVLNQCCKFGGKKASFLPAHLRLQKHWNWLSGLSESIGTLTLPTKTAFIGNHSKSSLCGYKPDALRQLPAHPRAAPSFAPAELQSSGAPGRAGSPQPAFGSGKRHGRLQSAPVSRHPFPNASFGFEARRLLPAPAALRERPGRLLPASAGPPRPAAPPPRPVPGLGAASPDPSTAASPTGPRRQPGDVAAAWLPRSRSTPIPAPPGTPPARAPLRHTSPVPTRSGGAQPNPDPTVPAHGSRPGPSPGTARQGTRDATGAPRCSPLFRSRVRRCLRSGRSQPLPAAVLRSLPVHLPRLLTRPPPASVRARLLRPPAEAVGSPGRSRGRVWGGDRRRGAGPRGWAGVRRGRPCPEPCHGTSIRQSGLGNLQMRPCAGIDSHVLAENMSPREIQSCGSLRNWPGAVRARGNPHHGPLRTTVRQNAAPRGFL